MTAPTTPVALVLITHSPQLARGAAEIAEQMAPDVAIRPVGGTDDDRIGTSFDRVLFHVQELQEAGTAVLLLADLGSALLTAESVVEVVGEQVMVIDVPFVEGTVAAAVAAQTGEDLPAVAQAARSAIDAFDHSDAAGPTAPAEALDPGDARIDAAPHGPSPAGGATGTAAGAAGQAQPAAPTAPVDGDQVHTRTVTLNNTLGLHARPAAQVARMVAEYDATVTINGVNAASVLALMGLGLTGRAEVTVAAAGNAAEEILTALVADFDDGFGED